MDDACGSLAIHVVGTVAPSHHHRIFRWRNPPQMILGRGMDLVGREFFS